MAPRYYWVKFQYNSRLGLNHVKATQAGFHYDNEELHCDLFTNLEGKFGRSYKLHYYLGHCIFFSTTYETAFHVPVNLSGKIIDSNQKIGSFI